MQETLIHHGVMFSYYSAKTRACLSYKRIPFVEQYQASELQGRIKEVIHKMMIPVVEMPDGELLQDTTQIIDELERRYPQRPVLPEDPVMLLVSRLVEFTMDELWISTAMNTRWHDPLSKAFIITEFGARIGDSAGLSADQGRAMGEQLAQRMQSYLPRLGVGSAQGQAVVDRFFRAASLSLDKLVGRTRFALGPRPSLIDFCLFTGYYGHQYRDPGVAQRFLKTEAPGLCYYLDNLHAAQCAPEGGELVITEALQDYLQLIGPPSAGFARGIQQGTAQLAAAASPGQLFEQPIADFSFELMGEPFSRAGSSFSAWKLQRVQEVFNTLNPAQQAQADALLADTGWPELLRTDPGYRLERKDYQIYLESVG
ncbi:MAG: glutathione S-transferase N-terminal domain-containing protein [Pseudomonadales bacterium]|nr:glutathione S-transferase N-terminal domain-containing protein [Pseudomonadales bacterium]